MWVNSFSLARCFLRAVTQSSCDTTLCAIMANSPSKPRTARIFKQTSFGKRSKPPVRRAEPRRAGTDFNQASFRKRSKPSVRRAEPHNEGTDFQSDFFQEKKQTF